MKKRRLKLSIVIPAYNEVDNFKKGVLNQIDEYVKSQIFSSQVIIVDDGSSDATAEKLEKWVKNKKEWILIRNPHKGKALAVTKGIIEADGEYILFTDFDQATPISELEKLWPFIKKGYDLAIGSREVKGSRREKEPWYRHLMGRAWNTLVQLLAVEGIQDTQCGFKLFKSNIARDLFNSLVVYRDADEKQAYTGAFDVEILFIAKKRGYQIAEVPVHWSHVKTTRVHPLRDSLRMFIDLLKIRWADLRGEYEN